MKEAIIFFYNPSQTKHCKITVNSISENEVEICVEWRNITKKDEQSLWYKSASAYIENIK